MKSEVWQNNAELRISSFLQMTRKKKSKNTERKTATFVEHLRFFALPFLITSCVTPLLFVFIFWLFFINGNLGDPGFITKMVIALIAAFLITFFFHSKRTDLLHNDSPAHGSRKLSDGISIYVHGFLIGMSLVALFDFHKQGFIESDLPGFSHPVPENKTDFPFWLLIHFFAGNLIWIILTSIPIMYRKDLYTYLGKPVPPLFLDSDENKR